MEGKAAAARRELAGLGQALTEAERGWGPRPPAVALMARLLRSAVLRPDAMGVAVLLHVADIVADGDVGYEDKVAVIRMGWAALVQAARRAEGLALVAAGGARARAVTAA
nr:hypothetical protein [Azospirillum sp. SYSU D00513]